MPSDRLDGATSRDLPLRRREGVSRHWWRRRLFLAAALALFAFAGATVRLFVWPPLAALPEHADAVVILGGQGDRDSVGIGLARSQRVTNLVQSTTAQEAGTHTCLPTVSGVTVLCFHADPATTRGEAESIRRLAVAYHWTSVILVTTPDQALRAQLRVGRCFSGAIYSAIAPLPPLDWLRQIPYQWAASAKALVLETAC